MIAAIGKGVSRVTDLDGTSFLVVGAFFLALELVEATELLVDEALVSALLEVIFELSDETVTLVALGWCDVPASLDAAGLLCATASEATVAVCVAGTDDPSTTNPTV